MNYSNNFKLNKEAEDYAQKLIGEANKSKSLIGGIISKSNVKLDDDFFVIEGQQDTDQQERS